jgi:uncharacterized membrane protein YhaH (DUF805 family)
MRNVARLWFGLSLPVGRRSYLLSGIGLALLKLAGDAVLMRIGTGAWSPLASLSAWLGSRLQGEQWVWMTMAAWALPFVWIGVSMTLRRLIDANLSPWLSLLFFVPYANVVLFAVLCSAKSRPAEEPPLAVLADAPRIRSALIGVAGGVAVGAASMGIQLLGFKSYNAAVFLGTPFVMGAVAGYAWNREARRDKTLLLGALTVLVAALAMLLFALEGILCIAMALPLAVPLGMLGARVGQFIAVERRESRPAMLAVFLLLSPLAAVGPLPLREVRTSVEIDAPPERVWPHVVQFAEVDEPPQWFFRLGIAYPVRARIEGRGPGAVRRCEFSTGAFVEPITLWDEPRRLGFDVQSSPPPLHELSPYKHVHAEHLLDTLQSRRGEFRLIPLPGGRTRLEGSTFYTLAMDPQPYWAFWADALIHQIHQRVLDHIRREVER